MTRVPVVLFIHARPRETEAVFEAIRTARPEVLYIFADGPRREKIRDFELCEAARRLTERVDWICEVKRIYRDSNAGLAQSILSGLDQVFKSHASAIVLEDDCVPDQEFFSFVEKALNDFANEPNVAMVSGNNFGNTNSCAQPFFSGHPRIWGWATWSDRWQKFRGSATGKVDYSWKICSEAIPGWFERLLFWSLERNSGSVDSWAISFAKHVHHNALLCLNPGTNLVENIGFSDSARHTSSEKLFLSLKARPTGNPRFGKISVQRSRSLERAVSRAQLARLIRNVLFRPSLIYSVLLLTFAHARRVVKTKQLNLLS